MNNPPISTSARQHLVDADNVERVHAHAQMERVLPARLGHILVRANARGFKGFGGELLILVGDEVAAEGKVVDRGAFATQVEDTDLVGCSYKNQRLVDLARHLGVGNTAVIAGLWVWLVLAVAVAASGTATHR